MLRFCALASGSSGNATWVASETTSILIDAGTPARTIVDRMASLGADAEKLDGILITHAHADHYRAAGTLTARLGVPIYVDPTVDRALKRRRGRSSWRRVVEPRPLPERIGDLEIHTLDTSHAHPTTDGRTVGFRVSHGKRSVTALTDLGSFDLTHIAALKKSDAVLLEANYEESWLRRKLSDLRFARQWDYLMHSAGDRGHLSNDQCADLLIAGLRDSQVPVLLAHLSENHDRKELDNNDYETASTTVRRRFEESGMTPPPLHRTYRSGSRSAGQASVVLEIG